MIFIFFKHSGGSPEPSKKLKGITQGMRQKRRNSIITLFLGLINSIKKQKEVNRYKNQDTL